MNTKCLIVLICSVLGIQALHCSDAGSAVAGGAQKLSLIDLDLFQALLKPTVTVEIDRLTAASGGDSAPGGGKAAGAGDTGLMLQRSAGAGGAQKLSLIDLDLFQALLKPTVTVEEVAALLASGAEVHARDKIGRTSLHFAAASYSVQASAITQLLLANGADVDARDNRGHTPLHYAASSRSPQAPDIITLFLEKDASVKARDNHGHTPLHYAASSRSPQAPDIVNLLLANGADVDVHATDNSGKTPLDYAYNEKIKVRLAAVARDARLTGAAAAAPGDDTASGGGGSAGAGDAGL